MPDKIKPLKLDGDFKKRICRLELQARAYVYSNPDSSLAICLEDESFSAYRELCISEVEAIRDWCNEALASVTEAA